MVDALKGDLIIPHRIEANPANVKSNAKEKGFNPR
jgi:hypothetical protein